VNIKKSSKGLDENMQAAKHNFLLKGFFNKKAKAAQKTKDSIAAIKAKEQKVIDKKKK
jgi:phospholipid/cholesterol/gamma-HCH transport system substrate-binding protein